MADAQDSGSCPGNRVEVQVLSRPRRSGSLRASARRKRMSSEALALAKTGLEAWRQGDFDVIEGLLDPAVEWHWFEPGEWDCYGREAVMDVVRERHAQGF